MKFIIKNDLWLEQILKKKCYHLIADKVKGKEFKTFPTGFISCKLNPEDFKESFYLQSKKFLYIDNQLTFSSKEKLNNKFKNCELAKKTDISEILRLTSFLSNSRFHNDNNINIKQSNMIKEKWVSNFFLGLRGDGLVIYRGKNSIEGFLLYLKEKKKIVIDLIVVDPKKREKKIGKNMIHFLSNLHDNFTIQAGTQASNLIAIKFYQKIGFKLSSSKIILHKS